MTSGVLEFAGSNGTIKIECSDQQESVVMYSENEDIFRDVWNAAGMSRISLPIVTVSLSAIDWRLLLEQVRDLEKKPLELSGSPVFVEPDGPWASTFGNLLKEELVMVENEKPVEAVETEKPKKSIGECTHVTSILTTKVYKEGGLVIKEEAAEEEIMVRIPPKNVALAKVGAHAQMTINMGNYESVQLGVSIELPCVVEEVTDCYKTAKSIVDLHLNKEVVDIRKYRDDKGKKSGGK